MGIDDGFDVVVQITDQNRWEKTMDVIRRQFRNSGILKEHEEDFEDIKCIDMVEASEGLNFSAGANRWSWHCFTTANEEGVKAQLHEVLQKLRDDPEDYGLTSKRDSLMATLKTLRAFSPGLRQAVQCHCDENRDEFRRRYMHVPTLFEFTVGEHPRLPRYARHFRKFSSKVSGRCGDAQGVINTVFGIMQKAFGKQAIVQTGDGYMDYIYEMAEMHGKAFEEYPPPLQLATNGSAQPFYQMARKRLLESKVPRVMLVIQAARSMGIDLPSPANAKIFTFLPRALK